MIRSVKKPKPFNDKAMKIGIIGGGAAGLMAAWLLETDHEVILFEKEDHLGGHIDTVQIPSSGKDVSIDAGFEFFSEPLFPILCRLLKILDVAVRPYPLTYTFLHNDEALVLPPFAHNRISWRSMLPKSLGTLITFNQFLLKGKALVDASDTTITMDEFAQDLKMSSTFRNDFLYPFYAGAWGAPLDDLKAFAAYDVLYWSLKNKPAGLFPRSWLEIVGGGHTYKHAFVHQLLKTKTHLSATINAIERHENGYEITHGFDRTYVDHLIIATNALEAKKLIALLNFAKKQQEALDGLDYFFARIAIHGDESWMPKNKSDWSVANIAYNGKKASLTVNKPRGPFPLFRSWITECNEPPDSLYALREYYHPKVNRNYFSSQRLLQELQGQHNLWFAGIYMYGIDSHDSALTSAIAIAQSLQPTSERLRTILQSHLALT